MPHATIHTSAPAHMQRRVEELTRQLKTLTQDNEALEMQVCAWSESVWVLQGGPHSS